MKKLVSLVSVCLFFLFMGVSQPAVAQYNASDPMIMQMMTAELQKRGLTEAEARARLLQEGINVDNLTPADAPQYQTRILAILDKMQTEKKGGMVGTAPLPLVTDSTNVSTTTEKLAVNNTTVQTPKVTPANKSDIYAHSIFTDKSIDVIQSTDGAQAPDTYVIGEGDEIHITIFGASQTDIQQRVNAQGAIQPVGAAKLFVKGLTLAQAREMIKRQLSSSYLFREDQISVSLLKVRTIMVNVFGEVNASGGINISALNSALNALVIAEGPTEIGSVRNIQIIRGNSRRNVDLYSFMTDPSRQYDFGLQNNDIIYVPVAQKVVRIEGAVNRPMSYEMLAKESLKDLIYFAGGLKKDVYPEFVQVERFENGDVKLNEYKLGDVLSGKIKVDMANGDIVRIKNIGKTLDQYVEVEGSVYYPGKYDLKANASLSTLIKNAKPNFQAKTDFLFVERLRPDSTVEVLTVPFPTASAQEYALQARDKIRVLDQAAYRDMDTISVNGQVRKPFSRSFGLNDKLTVNQAIDLAGGLKSTVYPVAYIFRKNVFNPSEMKYIQVNLNEKKEVYMQPGDQLNVYDNTTYSNVGQLRVSGAVKNPSSYTFDATMSVQDLILNAGGLNFGAAYNRVEVFRVNLSSTEAAQLELITLTVDSTYKVVAPLNFHLQPFDHVVARMTPEFTTGRMVEVNGEVKYPGVYVLESKETQLSEIIKKAGGLLKSADPNGTTLFRTYKNRGTISVNINGAIYHPNSYAENPVLFEGDVVNINRLENTVTIMGKGTGLVNYVTDSISVENVDSIFKSLDRQSYPNKVVVYRGGRLANWYIKKFAGGFNKNADRTTVTVTYPNNETRSTKHFWFFRSYPKVVPGSTIELQLSPDKIKAESKPKEHLDFETTLSKSLSIMMSTISIILLVQRL